MVCKMTYVTRQVGGKLVNPKKQPIPVRGVDDDAWGCGGEGLCQQGLGDDVLGWPVCGVLALVLGSVHQVALRQTDRREGKGMS